MTITCRECKKYNRCPERDRLYICTAFKRNKKQRYTAKAIPPMIKPTK